MSAPLSGPLKEIRDAFHVQLSDPLKLAQLGRHASLLKKILEREINDPFLTYWYETKQSPLDSKELEDSVAELNLDTEQEAKIKRLLEAYKASVAQIKPQCTEG
jgi:hypothetical protein